MKQFAQAYPAAVLAEFLSVDKQLKENALTQQTVVAMLQANKKQFVIAQQPAAQFSGQGDEMNAITQQPVAQLEDTLFIRSVLSKISWAHHLVLMDKEPHLGKRLWYMLNSLEHGNSRNVLRMQIESGLFERQVIAKKVNNFERTLPAAQTDFANYLLKDPYIFDFVQAKERADERDIEEQLASQITKFLLEL